MKQKRNMHSMANETYNNDKINEPLQPFFSIVLPILLALFAGYVYSFSFHYPFQFDDLANIVKNFNVRSGSFAQLCFRGTRWISQWLNSIYFNWGHFDPYWYRVGNVFFHCLAGICTYYVVALIMVPSVKKKAYYSWRAFIAAAVAGLFLLHPTQTQTVSYIIQGQQEGLAALVSLFLLVCMNQVLRASGIKQIVWTILLYVGAILAPGTKEIAIITPILLLIADWFFISQGNVQTLKKHAWLHMSMMFIIWGMYIFYLKPAYFMNILGLKMEIYNNMGNKLTPNIKDRITPLWYAISQFKVIWHYAFIYVWPFNLSVDYDWYCVSSFWATDCIFPLLGIVLVLSYVSYRLYYNAIDPISFGVLWFFICILPRSSIVPGTELLADYKAYLASLGIFWVIMYLFMQWYDYYCATYTSTIVWLRDGRLLWMLLISLLATCAYGTYTRNKVWSSALEFWKDIVRTSPNKPRPNNNYGVALCEAGKNAESIIYFQRAIAGDHCYSDPHNNLAVAYGALGEYDKAIAALNNSIKIHSKQPEAYNNMASFYIEKNDLDKASELLDTAIQLRPHYGKAHFNYGRVWERRGNLIKACESFKKCCYEGDFDTPYGFYACGMSHYAIGNYSVAIDAFMQALKHDPRHADAYAGLGHTYLALKDYTKSLEAYKKLLSFHPRDPFIIAQIGIVLGLSNKHQEAIELLDSALALKPDLLIAHIHRALAYYRNHDIEKGIAILQEVCKQQWIKSQECAAINRLIADMQQGKVL